MRIPLSWIAEFTELPNISIAEIGRLFTLRSCEVEGILACRDGVLPELWSRVQLVEVRQIKEHAPKDSAKNFQKDSKVAKLFCVTIATEAGKIQVVCGAGNLSEGLKTLWAPAGSEMCCGDTGQNFILKDKEIRGVFSKGMLCSERELGLSDEHLGIIELNEFLQQANFKLGTSFAEILSQLLRPQQNLCLNGKNISGLQFILEVDNKSLTHRPDLWGIYGLAREFGAVFPQLPKPVPQEIPKAAEPQNSGLPIYGHSSFNCNFIEKQLPALPRAENSQTARGEEILLDIAKDSSCLSYCVLAVDGIQIKDSPVHIQQRLRLAGLSVINSVVDISNYVMLELGIPNHIFDRDKLRGDKICVYRLRQPQEFFTLDGQRRQLQMGDTVVADAFEPQVVAGIMGGQNSSVSAGTRRLLLEVAVWDSYEVHKSSLRLGLRSESSLRYEKSLDPYAVENSLARLWQLLRQIHPEAKIRGHLQSYYQKPLQKFCLETSAAQIARVLGYPLANAAGQKLIEQIFGNLGFSCQITADGQKKKKKKTMSVDIPSYRSSKDIALEEDLIEEIGRIIGYDNIAPQVPLAKIGPTAMSRELQLARKIRNFLVLNGRAQEILSYPLIGRRILKQAHWHSPLTEYDKKNGEDSALNLLNPLNPEQDRLRPSLIPSHLELLARQAPHKQRQQLRLFELGRSYHSPQKSPLQPQEQRHLIVSIYTQVGENPILELRHLCERLLRHLGAPAGLWQNNWQNDWQTGATEKKAPDLWPQFIPQDWDGIHPQQRLCWHCKQNPSYPAVTEAWIFSVHPALLGELKLRGKLALACIPLCPVSGVVSGADEKNLGASARYFQPLQRFPTVEFDCTVILPPRVFAAAAIEALKLGVGKRYERMNSLLQKVWIRSIYPIPNNSGPSNSGANSYGKNDLGPNDSWRWLTMQCVFADARGTLTSAEIKQLEEQTVTILSEAGFPLKMENARQH